MNRSLWDARDLRLATIKAVRDLMNSAGTSAVELDALIPHSNGYSCWFIGVGQIGTAPLTDEEILRRIEAREALEANRRA